MKKIPSTILFAILLVILSNNALSQNALVFQTDFGLEEPAVASMKGVAYSVSSELKMFDITHEIPRFNIWEAAYRLDQAAKYWPTGTVFVNVVDPGVGSERKSVVMKTKTGQFFVSPDNGSLSLVSETLGVDEIREINEDTNRLPGSERSHTFHGRDVYAYTGARLASNQIDFEEVGPKISTKVTLISHPDATIKNNIISGYIPILDTHYGNVWTNISTDLFDTLDLNYGERVNVKIHKDRKILFQEKVVYDKSFSGVKVGDPIIYVNDILNIGIAINQGDMAEKYKIKAGPEMLIEISK